MASQEDLNLTASPNDGYQAGGDSDQDVGSPISVQNDVESEQVEDEDDSMSEGAQPAEDVQKLIAQVTRQIVEERQRDEEYNCRSNAVARRMLKYGTQPPEETHLAQL